MELLQRRYKPLQSRYQALRKRYTSVTSRYTSVTHSLHIRYRAGWLQGVCLATAFAPVPAFLGGSCPLGCSRSAPATGGLSMVSAVLMYAAGSEKEKRGGRRLHRATIAQTFGFCKGGLAGAEGKERGGLWWRAPSISGGSGLACAVHRRGDCLGGRRYQRRVRLWPMPLSRPLRPRTFWVQGDTP